jgi:hypothetical protein
VQARPIDQVYSSGEELQNLLGFTRDDRIGVIRDTQANRSCWNIPTLDLRPVRVGQSVP